MTIEGISSPKMTYQGSASVTETMPTDAVEEMASESVAETAILQGTETTVPLQQAVYNNGDEPAEIKTGTEALKKAVEEINRNAKNSEAIFGVHEATNRVTIKIVDKESKKVIREFPPEKTLDMIAKVWEMAGLMVDEKR